MWLHRPTFAIYDVTTTTITVTQPCLSEAWCISVEVRASHYICVVSHPRVADPACSVTAADAAEVPEEGADSLKVQLQDLEEERKAATAKAESLASKGKRLAEAITNLQHGALQAMKAGDEAAARELLQVGCSI